MDARDVKDLQTLIAVHAEGGFAPAARRLGLTRAAVSRAIAQLEARLGVRLARRTTRQVALTDAAHGLVARCEAPLEALAAALEAARDQAGELAGRVRLAGPTAFGRDALVPLVLAFRARHPAVTIDLALDDRLTDLVARPIDVTVRLGPLPESSMIARPAGHLPLVLVAAPALLAGRLPPRRVADLATWPAVAFRVPGTERRFPWPFVERGAASLFSPAAPAAESDAVDAVVAFARAGAGLAVAPRHAVAADLAAGALVALPRPTLAAGPEVHVCYAHSALMPRRVRALVDHLVAALPGALDGRAGPAPARARRARR